MLITAPAPVSTATDELRRTKNFLKGRLVLQLEDPRGLLGFAQCAQQ